VPEFRLSTTLAARDDASRVIRGSVARITSSIARGTRTITGLTGKANAVLGGLARRLGPAAGLGSAAVIGGLAATFEHTRRNVQELQRLADRFRIGEKAMQGFAFAGRQVGLDLDRVADLFKDLPDRMLEAAKGTGEQAEVFRALGIKVRGARGKLKSTTAVIFELADAVKRLTDQGKGEIATGLIDQLLSDVGTDFLSLFRRGSKGFKAAIADADKFGAVLSGSALKAIGKVNAELLMLREALGGVSNEILSAMAPAVADLLPPLTEWIRANRAVIGQRVAESVKQLAAALKAVDWSEVIAETRAFARSAVEVFEAVGGVKAVLIGLSAVLVGNVITGMAQAVSAIVALKGAFVTLNAVVVANPIGAALTGIALAGVAVYQNWSDIKQLFDELVDGIMAMTKHGDRFARTARGFANFFGLGRDTTTDLIPDGNGSVSPRGMRFDAPRVDLDRRVGLGDIFGPGQPQSVGGEVSVRFENAPAGLRVDRVRSDSPAFAIETSVGRRGLSTGMGL